MLTLGQTVTVKVRNRAYLIRDRYACKNAGPEFYTYTGIVMREKFFDSDEIGLTTGKTNFPFRRIKLSDIVKVNDSAVDIIPVKNERITKTVQGSKGQTYIVTKENGKVSCTCTGYQFRKTCKHIQELG